MQASRCLFHDFYDLTHFSHHIFSKMLFLPRRGAQFCKTISYIFDWKFLFFDPRTASIRAFFAIWFALFALLAVPIAIFSLHAPPRASQSLPGSPFYRQDDPKYEQKVRIVVQSRSPMSKSTPKWPQSDQKVSIDRAVDIRKSLKSIGKMCISVKHAVHSQSDVEVTLICPKRSENTPKMCQGTPQVTPQWPQRVPKVRLKWLPNAPKWRQSRPWPWGSGALFRFEAVLQS